MYTFVFICGTLGTYIHETSRSPNGTLGTHIHGTLGRQTGRETHSGRETRSGRATRPLQQILVE